MRPKAIRASTARSTSSSDEAIHPGQFVRNEYLKPKNLSVTAAAELIGISRPGVSNFLNGKVATTPEMASRIERAFKVDAQTLLDMQAAYDAAHALSKGAPANTKSYVPPYLAIKANDIEAWVSHNIPARIRLSVFLRTLIHSTGVGLTKVDFPGNDDAERPGWDGIVDAKEGTPWIPAGLSGWEFGTNKDVKGKVEKDFAKSSAAIDKAEREKMTFVFVSPREWTDKDKWAAEAKARGLWKDVRAYDASDLEQWLEQSLPGQAWFANETLRPAQDVRSLDKCWSDWADVSDPPLAGSLFSSAIEATKRRMISRLANPPDAPTVIAADSVEEALAFLSQLLGERGGTELASFRDRVLVFDKPGVLPRLAQGKQTFIPVAFTREVERELAPFSRSMHCIVVYPRNAANAEPHITLEPLGYENFRTSLGEMGKHQDDVARLTNASGRSLTVLRRQLSNVPAVRSPHWAADHSTASSLVPFLFVGAWDSKNETDQTGLSLAGGKSYEELEKTCQSLLRLNDTPVWLVGAFRGVISKIDLLYAIAGSITAEDLRRYFSLAKMVLSEDDPALDLAPEDRWAASIHGKKREFSGAFREGISETLVLLAVHGNRLFKGRLGVDTEIETSVVVSYLLRTPLDMRVLEANDRDLPTYAEAAPDTFLSIIENDLNTEQPAVLGLMHAADPNILGRGISRTGLLWALEGLSWNPATLPRAACILARLARVEINDNWVNKPTHSLESIFRAWMPQTAASHEERVNVMKLLAERFPDVAWTICVAQFGNHHQVGDYSHKPRWRPDGYGFGEPFPTTGPVWAFMREMVDMALGWESYSLEMLGDLISKLQDLPAEYQARVWALVKSWADNTATDDQKATLREKIRVSLLSHRAARRIKKEFAVALKASAKAAYDALQPSDLLNKHAWLFRDGWVEDSADEIHGDEDFDFKKREERISQLRKSALAEVLKESGIEGLLQLTDKGQAGWQIGWLTAESLLKEEELPGFIRAALEPVFRGRDNVFQRKKLVSGALWSQKSDEKRAVILQGTSKPLSHDEIVALYLLAPFRRATWKLVDKLADEAQAKYWQDVAPDWIHDSDEENSEAVERLLKAERPRAAFACVHLRPEKLDARVLFRLLTEMSKVGKDLPGHYQLEQYSTEQAFKHINESADLSLDEKAGLEFAYIQVLARPWNNEGYGIPNLERYVEKHPESFVQAMVWAYKRKDDKADPAEFVLQPEFQKTMAERGYKLLEGLSRVPGHNDLGVMEKDRLAVWIKTVRESCAELSRADIADERIGKLLSAAPVGDDGVWPCEPVRDVMEELQSKHIMQGAHVGLYNARGAVWRGEGGGQERELADKYRKWAEAIQYTHPYVASQLLMDMAKTYEYEANREDTEAGIRRRLR